MAIDLKIMQLLDLVNKLITFYQVLGDTVVEKVRFCHSWTGGAVSRVTGQV